MNALAWFTPYRLGVLSRVLAASLGGYVFVNVAALALSFMIPVAEHYKSLLFSIQVSFVLYTLVIIWAFAARSATRAWVGLLLVGAPFLAFDLFIYRGLSV